MRILLLVFYNGLSREINCFTSVSPIQLISYFRAYLTAHYSDYILANEISICSLFYRFHLQVMKSSASLKGIFGQRQARFKSNIYSHFSVFSNLYSSKMQRNWKSILEQWAWRNKPAQHDCKPRFSRGYWICWKTSFNHKDKIKSKTPWPHCGLHATLGF